MRVQRTAAQNFWAKVRKSDGCWEWTGALQPIGYGQFGYKGKVWLSHRAAYDMLVGPITNGLCVLHKCDNRRCVRPDHLFLGTQADNIRDCSEKGRTPSLKLNREQVAEIRTRYAAGGVRQGVLAAEYGVSFQLIHLIVRQKRRN